MIRAGVIGVSGLAEGELVRLLAHHPELELTFAGGSASAGLRVGELHPGLREPGPTIQPATKAPADRLDVVFLATPAAVSANLAALLTDRVPAVIDLSGAFRIRTPHIHERWYPGVAREVTADHLLGSDGLLSAGPGERLWWQGNRLVERENLVGPPTGVNTCLLERARPGHVCVVTPLARNAAGQEVNTDADRAAAAIAGAAGAQVLVLVTDVPHLRVDGSPVRHITREAAIRMRDTVATGGMRKAACRVRSAGPARPARRHRQRHGHGPARHSYGNARHQSLRSLRRRTRAQAARPGRRQRYVVAPPNSAQYCTTWEPPRRSSTRHPCRPGSRATTRPSY
ncbi:hypothetical protein ABZ380_14955 [Streptomyces sp. NPDC005901]|uniref:amino acid kinase family protein n=1 Tax=Streptomyces sp. NPDC005901 TaxID=3157171 RepID=UPI0033D51B76